MQLTLFMPPAARTLAVGLMLAAFAAVASLSPVEAAPGLSDCRSLAKVCVEPNQTRRINGHNVHAACWKWKDTYDCARPKPIRTDCGYLTRDRYCAKTGRTCIRSKDRVCERYRVAWHCTAKPWYAGRATLTSERYRIRSERLVSACTAQERRRDCRRTTQRCVLGSATRTIKGMRIRRSCWRYERTYECLGSTMQDDCGPLEQDANCRLTETGCLSTGPDGSCVNEERVYSCGADSDGDVSQTCSSAAWCVDGDCTNMPRQPANRSFGRAASAMNLLQEMGKDFGFEGDGISVFKGDKLTCSKWLLGLKNCCKVGGLLLDADLAECSEREKKLAASRAARLTTHADSYCKQKTFFGLCVVKAEDHCVFKSRLGRILQEQARQQIGIPKTNCRGLSVEELERVDWSRIDISEILGDIEARLKPMEAERMKAGMKSRIEAYYRRIRAGQGGGDSDNSTGSR